MRGDSTRAMRVMAVSYTHLDVYKRQEWACATPPTRKNSGMTCRTQVTGCSLGMRSRVLVISPVGVTATMSQCPTMTTSREPTRKASAHRSRSAGVAAATDATVDGTADATVDARFGAGDSGAGGEGGGFTRPTVPYLSLIHI